jgi:hypothetical protein
MMFAVGALLALTACTTTQIGQTCEKAPGIRQAALTTIAAIDATCPMGAETPDTEKYCATAMLIRNAALLTLGQVNAACPMVPMSAEQVTVFRQADAATEAQAEGTLPLPPAELVPEELRW